jgi:DNA-binding CsgD family transcriptional regulator
VARGGPRVAERRRWLEPYLPADLMAEYIAKGLYAEEEYWAGDLTAAVQTTWETIKAAAAWGEGYSPQTIRPAAVGIAALGDLARHARAGGHGEEAARLGAEALELLEAARVGADTKLAVGVDGRGWLARAEAEYRRAVGDNDQAHWRKVLDTFEPDFAYETARSRWRLAEALAEAGSRDEAQEQWLLAAEVADRLGAARLRQALTDLGRRARLGRGPAANAAGASPLGVLTSRELEVLTLVAAGRSNREIAAELFIAAKTVSVHVSNILAKLGAASRTEAAAIAHSNGVHSIAGHGRG